MVPIQIKLDPVKNKHLIIGFICVDNSKGGFETIETKDFLLAFGDILFNLFLKYDEFTKVAIEEGVKNDRIQIYTNWNDS